MKPRSPHLTLVYFPRGGRAELWLAKGWVGLIYGLFRAGRRANRLSFQRNPGIGPASATDEEVPIARMRRPAQGGLGLPSYPVDLLRRRVRDLHGRTSFLSERPRDCETYLRSLRGAREGAAAFAFAARVTKVLDARVSPPQPLSFASVSRRRWRLRVGPSAPAKLDSARRGSADLSFSTIHQRAALRPRRSLREPRGSREGAPREFTMSNKMIIDASHPEETRVVVLRGNRVEEFDFESANKKPLRGNIYLAKVTRVEPSLQAAFVEYGGNRHGFLAFSEIHPDYYQIPVADRQALLEEEARSHREEEDEPSGERRSRRRQRHRPAGERRAAVGEKASRNSRSWRRANAQADSAPNSRQHRLRPTTPARRPPTRRGRRRTRADRRRAPTRAEACRSARAVSLTRSPSELSGEDPTVTASPVDSDEPADEMAPRFELGEPPLREDEDEEGPTVAIEAQAARDEAEEPARRTDEVEVRHIHAPRTTTRTRTNPR